MDSFALYVRMRNRDAAEAESNAFKVVFYRTKITEIWDMPTLSQEEIQEFRFALQNTWYDGSTIRASDGKDASDKTVKSYNNYYLANTANDVVVHALFTDFDGKFFCEVNKRRASPPNDLNENDESAKLEIYYANSDQNTPIVQTFDMKRKVYMDHNEIPNTLSDNTCITDSIRWVDIKREAM